MKNLNIRTPMRIWGKNMNKKILIGSIIAVTILIDVSFTSVVGYRSVDSDAKASPLFNIRINRAIQKDSENLNYDYIGKGNGINILLPTRNNKVELLEKFVDVIGRMDDKSFDKFVNLILSNIFTRDDFQEYQQEDIIMFFNHLRNNPTEIKSYIIIEKDKPQLITPGCTFGFGCYYTKDKSSILECIWIFTIFLLMGLSAIFGIIIIGIFELFKLITLYNCQ